jgi:hypothetical protein
MVRKKPYVVGDWFAVPIDAGYVPGRIARVGRRGRILLGYFFAPLFARVPDLSDVCDFQAHQAFNVCKFGDGGLTDGSWPIIASREPFKAEHWPLPTFGRVDGFDGTAGYCVQYDEYDLSILVREWRCTAWQAIAMPPDGMSGHIFVEKSLEKYFKFGQRPYDAQDKMGYLWFHGLPEQLDE